MSFCNFHWNGGNFAGQIKSIMIGQGLSCDWLGRESLLPAVD
jgi:hypothetical protein